MIRTQPLTEHKKYGLVDIPGVQVLSLVPGTSSKYKIVVKYNGATKTINFGDPSYQQYRDRTPLANYHRLDHGDNLRRKSYLARASAIRDSNGNLTCNDPFSANRWSILLLW
jgi:hypothetical protein